jgi:hypothetical protein
MKRRPIPKPEVLLWLLVFLGLSGYYLYSFHAQQRMIAAAEQSPAGRLEIPRLQRYGNTSTPLSDWPLWNLSPPGTDEQDSTVRTAPKSPYGLKAFGDVQALYTLKNPGVRWEFYGVFQKDGKARAIFRNPSGTSREWIAPALAEDLVPGLRLAEIAENQVVLEETEGEVGKRWQLRLFAEVTPIYRADLALGEPIQ